MLRSSVAFSVASVITLTLGLSSFAHADFVSNGNFETTTGYGQLANSSYTGGVTVSGWTTSGYNFIFNSSNASTGGVNGSDGNLQLWGPGNGVANGLGASPNGGNFIGADGAYEVSPITQTINNLVVGHTYQLGFYWAGAQQYNFSGVTTEQWQVSLGGTTQSTAVVTNANHGFTGWMYQSFNYVATSASETLSFLAVGTPSGEPPFSLLDGVTVNSVPEPSTLVLMGLGLIGFAGYGWKRRRKLAV